MMHALHLSEPITHGVERFSAVLPIQTSMLKRRTLSHCRQRDVLLERRSVAMARERFTSHAVWLPQSELLESKSCASSTGEDKQRRGGKGLQVALPSALDQREQAKFQFEFYIFIYLNDIFLR